MTTKALRLRPELHSEDSPISFMSRLALINGCGSMRDFASDMILPSRNVINGDSTALDRLALLGGVDRDRLRHNAIIEHPAGAFSLRGEVFARVDLFRSGLRYCPTCLLEDLRRPIVNEAMPQQINAYGRLAWKLVCLRCCPEHGVEIHQEPLLRIGDLGSDLSHHIGCSAFKPNAAAASDHAPGSSSLDRYIVSRINGIKSDSWYDAWPLNTVAETAERLGLLIELGADVKWRDTSITEKIKSADSGLAILREGEGTVRQKLSDFARQACVGVDGKIKAQGQFRYFYKWLYPLQHPHFAPIKDLVRDIILDTNSVRTGEIVLGNPWSGACIL